MAWASDFLIVGRKLSKAPVFMALFLSVGNGLTGVRRPVAVVRTKEARRALDIEFFWMPRLPFA